MVREQISIFFYLKNVIIEFYPAWPNDLLYIFPLTMLGLFSCIAGLAVLSPTPLGEPADPFNTPLEILPEWYFFPTFNLLRVLPNKLLGNTRNKLNVGKKYHSGKISNGVLNGSAGSPNGVGDNTANPAIHENKPNIVRGKIYKRSFGQAG